MADILAAFRKKAEELIESVNSAGGLRATIDGLRKQMAEADRRRAMGRARAELKRLDSQINELILAVGVQAVGLHRANRLAAPELAPLCQHVVELQAAVEEQRQELSRLEATEAKPAQAEAVCAQCGRVLPEGATFCPYCGAPVPRTGPETPRYCASCGAGLREGARFCARCGTAVSPP